MAGLIGGGDRTAKNLSRSLSPPLFFALQLTSYGYISAVSEEKSRAVESVTEKLPSFVLPRADLASDRQLELSTKFLTVAVEVLRLGNSRSFENENYRLNLTHPDMVLTVTDKLSQEVVYKTNYDSKIAAWVPDLNSCHLTPEIVDVFRQEVVSIKTAPSIPLHLVSEKPILAGNRNRLVSKAILPSNESFISGEMFSLELSP